MSTQLVPASSVEAQIRRAPGQKPEPKVFVPRKNAAIFRECIDEQRKLASSVPVFPTWFTRAARFTGADKAFDAVVAVVAWVRGEGSRTQEDLLFESVQALRAEHVKWTLVQYKAFQVADSAARVPAFRDQQMISHLAISSLVCWNAPGGRFVIEGLESSQLDSLKELEARCQEIIGHHLNRNLAPISLQPRASEEQVIATFDGHVERIADEVGYLTMTDDMGREYSAEIDAKEMAAEGIGDQDRFRCVIKSRAGETVLTMERLPLDELSDEEYASIDRRLDTAFPGDSSDVV
jgi:hypothetical protein